MRHLISIVVALSFSMSWGVLAPRVAHSQTCDDTGDIRFEIYTVAGTMPSTACIQCRGPHNRQSEVVSVAEIRDSIASRGVCHFYAANRAADFDPYAPYGDWTCDVFTSCDDEGGQGLLGSPTVCLGSRDTAVYIDLISAFPVNIVFEDAPRVCASRSVQSKLVGDDAGERDQDDFAFKGQAGDTVVVTVEPDNKSGHNGGKLILGSGVNPDTKTKGTLPLTFTDSVPASGDYSVIVNQVGDAAKRFKGTYHVIAESQSGRRLEPLVPLSNVE